MNLVIRDIENSDIQQLKRFQCGNTSMEVFLYSEARYSHVLGEGITKLVIESTENEIVAYYTIKCSLLKIEDPQMYSELREIPCIELSRIAVANDWQNGRKGIHLGTRLMDFIIDFIKNKIAIYVGCKYITLHAVSEKVKWYESLGFTPATDEMVNSHCSTVYMYMDITDPQKINEYQKLKANEFD